MPRAVAAVGPEAASGERLWETTGAAEAQGRIRPIGAATAAWVPSAALAASGAAEGAVRSARSPPRTSQLRQPSNRGQVAVVVVVTKGLEVVVLAARSASRQRGRSLFFLLHACSRMEVMAPRARVEEELAAVDRAASFFSTRPPSR